MKPKEESTPKYPDPGYEMYSNFRNNHQKTEKNKEERKRLKVFSNLSSVPPLSKKIDQRVITKEISKENNRDPETRFKQEFALEGFEDDANSHQQYNYQDSNIYQQDTIGRIRHENSVGQSLPSFSSEFDRARQITQKEKTSEVLNKSFNDVNMGASSFLASSPNDASMQFGLNQSHNANVFEQRDMSQDTKAFSSLPRSNPGIKSLKDNSRRGRREFFPSNRLNRGGMTFGKKSGNKNSSESDRTPDRKKPAQWGLKVDKINPSVGKIRKPDFLKKPSREIMISGVSSRELSCYLYNQLQKIGEIIEPKMKWNSNGQMNVKFVHPESAKKAIELFDGTYVCGSKLKVTQILQLNTSFKPKLGRFLNNAKLLPLIKENEESSDGEKVSSSENDKYSPNSIIENEVDTLEYIKKNITDLIDTEDPQENVEPQEKANNGNKTNSSNMGLDYSHQAKENWEDDQRYYEQEDFADNSQGRNQINGQLYQSVSSSSGGVGENNISTSEDAKRIGYFNRTQSVPMFNPIGSGISSLMNNSYESCGRAEDNEMQRSSRSYFSRSSLESNLMYQSACERTFASSGGMMDHNNSGMQQDLQQQMHSSFDLRDDPLNQYNTLTPRLASNYSFISGQNYPHGTQFCDLNQFSGTWTEPYHPLQYNPQIGMSTSYSQASLYHQKSISNLGEKDQQLSFESSSIRNQKNRKWLNNKFRPNKKIQSVHEKDDSKYMVKISDIIDRRDTRTTLMIKNIPNKYSIKQLLFEINQNNKERFNFLYVPIDVQNNCNVGYAFINFLDSAYILDFYQEYNDKGWDSYNSEKVCQIRYGRIQGRKKLISHFENTKVIKNKDRNVKPWISNKEEVNTKEIDQILERYKKKRAKDRADKLRDKFHGNDVPNENAKEEIPKKTKDFDKKKILTKLLEKTGNEKNDRTKAPNNVSSKWNSQKPANANLKLDQVAIGKHPSSDDEVKKTKVQKTDQNKPMIKSFRVNLKNIGKKSQES